jgi:hypothetical protein
MVFKSHSDNFFHHTLCESRRILAAAQRVHQPGRVSCCLRNENWPCTAMQWSSCKVGVPARAPSFDGICWSSRASAMVPVLCCRQLMLQLSGAKAPRVPTKEVADCSPDPLELECLLVASSSNLLLITGWFLAVTTHAQPRKSPKVAALSQPFAPLTLDTRRR